MTVMGVTVYRTLGKLSIEEAPKSSEIQSESEIIPPIISEPEAEPEPEDSNEEIFEDSEPADVSGQAGYFITPLDGEVIKEYDSENLQYSATYNDMRIHEGMDIKSNGSSDVLSAGRGIVTIIEENTTLGNVITIDHFDGILIRYCGVKNITVKENDEVFAGDILGEIGTVANEISDAPHIHIEAIRDGENVNPRDIFVIN